MFKFPYYEPEIRIEDLPGEEFEVECLDAQSAFVLLEVGAENEFSFYDYPKEADNGSLVLTGAHKLRVERRVRLDDFEMLEIKAWYAETGSEYTGTPASWNRIVNEGCLKDTLEVDEPGDKKWIYKAGTKSPEVKLFKPGLRINGHEPLLWTGEDPETISHWILEVSGAARVFIGSKSYRCLKVRWVNQEEKRPKMAEYYIADTGRTVYFRRYNGPGYENYEDFAGHPEVEFEGCHLAALVRLHPRPRVSNRVIIKAANPGFLGFAD